MTTSGSGFASSTMWVLVISFGGKHLYMLHCPDLYNGVEELTGGRGSAKER